MSPAKLIVVVVTLVLVITSVYSDAPVTRIEYKLSGRQLPSGKKLFAEVDKGATHYCRTSNIENSNPDWSERCIAEVQDGDDHARIGIEIRAARSLRPDESIGFSSFLLKDMLEVGVTLTDTVRDQSSVVGQTRLTVIQACKPGEPSCGLHEQHQNRTKPLHLSKAA